VNFKACLSIAGNFADLGVFKDSRVKPSRLFSLVVEPQTGRDFLEIIHHTFPAGFEFESRGIGHEELKRP
jgi:hypothetical protein